MESGRTIAGTTRARTRHLHCPQGFFPPRVTSAGGGAKESASREVYPRRLPPPSTLDLCHVWFYPRRAPFFGARKAAVDEYFIPIEPPLGGERGEKHAPDVEPDVFLFPSRATAASKCWRWGIARADRASALRSAQNPQNAFQNQPVIGSRSPKSGRRRKERLDDFPLPIVEQRLVVHPKLSTPKCSIVPAQNVVCSKIKYAPSQLTFETTSRVSHSCATRAALPFGDYKQSGWGREMGHEVLELYTQTKAV